MSAHSDDSDSILGESGYEILTDSTLLTDEDDDCTSSVASLDGHSEEEDNVSLAETESLSDQPSGPQHDIHPGIPSFNGLDDQDHEQHLDESDLTLREEHSQVSGLVFDEPEEYRYGKISVCRTVTHFDQNQTAEICRNLRIDGHLPTNLFATVRQTMTKQLLDVEGPLRVLYIGSPSAKDEITQKLGEALAGPVVASTSSSASWEGVKSPRFNIVPVSSFGTRSSSPEVELVESLGVEMTVDVCTAAKASKRDGKPDTLCLWLNGNQSVSSSCDNGAQIESPGWKSPHLAVIYVSEDDNVQKKMTRVCARSFMARHNIPTLVISQNPLYSSTETFTLNTESVHMCLESEGTTIPHRRMPIDLSTFLSLDVHQLNRNLACITKLGGRGNEVSSSARSPGMTSFLRDVEKTPHSQGGNLSNSLYWIREKKRDGLWKVFLVGWLFIFGVVGAAVSIAFMKYAKPLADTPVEHVIQSVTAITTMSTAAKTTSVSQVLDLHSSITRVPSCETKMDLSSFPQDLPKNVSDRFQVQVIGDARIILRPPPRYTALRKPPALYINITRHEQKVKAELSKVFDGVVYTINLDDDESWGVMNVTVTTKTKPIIKETFEVDFGTPWLKGAGWKMASQKGKELQSFLGQTTTDAKSLASDLGQTAGKQAQEFKEVMVARARELSGGVSKLYRDTKAASLSLLPYVNGKEYVRKAQSQAKTVWEKRAIPPKRKMV